MSFNKNQIIDEFSKLIVGSLTLVAALAWNDAFRGLFQQYPALKKHGPWIYAITVTIIVIVIISFMTHRSGL